MTIGRIEVTIKSENGEIVGEFYSDNAMIDYPNYITVTAVGGFCVTDSQSNTFVKKHEPRD